jgi:hypothetical protein
MIASAAATDRAWERGLSLLLAGLDAVEPYVLTRRPFPAQHPDQPNVLDRLCEAYHTFRAISDATDDDGTWWLTKAIFLLTLDSPANREAALRILVDGVQNTFEPDRHPAAMLLRTERSTLLATSLTARCQALLRRNDV